MVRCLKSRLCVGMDSAMAWAAGAMGMGDAGARVVAPELGVWMPRNASSDGCTNETWRDVSMGDSGRRVTGGLGELPRLLWACVPEVVVSAVNKRPDGGGIMESAVSGGLPSAPPGTTKTLWDRSTQAARSTNVFCDVPRRLVEAVCGGSLGGIGWSMSKRPGAGMSLSACTGKLRLVKRVEPSKLKLSVREGCSCCFGGVWYGL
mmetsp:Transcript_66267/g.111161  ORF Transcript_66267/g.111161 Transcript_66267/m.111161 type:complete len:205 (+) Transcript_66267:1512-2126(+)